MDWSRSKKSVWRLDGTILWEEIRRKKKHSTNYLSIVWNQ